MAQAIYDTIIISLRNKTINKNLPVYEFESVWVYLQSDLMKMKHEAVTDSVTSGWHAHSERAIDIQVKYYELETQW